MIRNNGKDSNNRIFIILFMLVGLMASQVFVKANSIERNNNIQKNNNSLILVGDSRTFNMSKWVDTSVSTKFGLLIKQSIM